MELLRLLCIAWAKKFGSNPRSAITFSTFRRVAADTGRFPEITWETVVLLTPAAFATAWMFGADSDELDRKLVCSFTIEFSQHGGKHLIRWGELNTNRFAREVECMPYGLAAQVVNSR